MNLSALGFVRVSIIRSKLKVSDIKYNTEMIKQNLLEIQKSSPDLILFPEMCITGYTLGDLVYQDTIRSGTVDSLLDLKEFSKGLSAVFVIGAPITFEDRLFNCAVLIGAGSIIGIVPKSYLPNEDEFYEKRWYTSGKNLINKTISIDGNDVPFGVDLIFQPNDGTNLKIGIEICEDLWAVKPPSLDLALGGANIILNLSASNELVGKSAYRRDLIIQQSARTYTNYIYVSAGALESTMDTVYSGYGLISECGSLIGELNGLTLEERMLTCDVDFDRCTVERLKSPSFKTSKSELTYRLMKFPWPKNREKEKSSFSRNISKTPFIPSNDKNLYENCDEILNIQAVALAKRINHIRCKRVVIGLSGGLDSTLAGLVINEAFKLIGEKDLEILALTMPGAGTSSRTKKNAVKLASNLNADLKKIDITEPVKLHLKDIGADFQNKNITFENSQARERTQILFDYANENNAMVVGTGDLSEAALGWSTYGGDHISNYHVNIGVPKTLVKHVIRWYSENRAKDSLKIVLNDILATPISPELLPLGESEEILQKTEDLIGKYILHDFFLFYFVRFGFTPQKIYFFAQKAFSKEIPDAEILDVMQGFFSRFFSNQFKRSCSPDGPKIGSIALSPRGDWRMPSDASMGVWLSDLEKLKVAL